MKLFLLMLCIVTQNGAGPSPSLDKILSDSEIELLARSEADRQDLIREAEATRDRARTASRKSSLTSKERKAAKELLATTEKLLESLRNRETFLGAALPEKAKSGQLGDVSVVFVQQVVSPKEVIARWEGDLYWISGIDTSEMVDGERTKLAGVFQVGKSRTYSTAIGGSKTIRTLAPYAVDEKKFRQALDALNAIGPAAASAPPPKGSGSKKTPQVDNPRNQLNP